ncbi:uncharacterized protein At1g51745-like isoform X2 [Phragmites australis]|uniref:uncharacterized protein At1g51745-like isoform X2 n=1 Tax=Phragmites australis TaxID=29695 RepID=UPI002D78B4B6|nr:uncharacterized protein At1g51745-like isoform X2 [Phragmites australis]
MVGSSVEGGADGDGGCCGVGDTSPGTIVWVRRRNGSWWPGRILGADELPPSQIMSPRSGTPVKLLGREDASVDWYNLEKSKRVKAFRCGEFDACIEKAEATQGTLVKKREKYARREDAILHALELERKQFASKYQTQGFRPGPPGNISACTKHCKDLGSTRYKSKKSKKRKDVSAPSDVKKEAGHCPLHAGSKRKFSKSLAQGNVVSNHMGDFSFVRHSQGGASLESKEKSIIVKKNRSDGSNFEDSLVLKSDRRQPLTQVLQSSAQLPHHLQQNSDYRDFLIGENNIPSLATFRSRRSRYAYMPSDSGETHSPSDLPSMHVASTGADFETESYLQHPGSFSEEQTSSDFVEKQIIESSERECSESETEDDADLLQSANVVLPIESCAPDPYSLAVSDKFRHVDYDDNEVTHSTYMPQLNESEEEDGSSELGISQWHMKGKRNSRNAAKRLVDTGDGNAWLNKSSGSMKGSLHKTNGGNPRKESMQTSGDQFLGHSSYQIKEEPNYDSDERDLFEDTCHSEVNLYRGKRYPSSLRTTRDLRRGYSYFNDYESDSSKISPLNNDANRTFRVDRNACWDGSLYYQRKSTSRFGGMGPMLFDVDLKVQASYQGEHVPLVSLMSRLNGKAIVGHPIQIEILEDDSTDHLVFCGDTSLQESTAAPPAWPTGRRTMMQRVPRSNPPGALLDGDDDGGTVYPDWEMKPAFRKYSASSNHQKKNSNARRSSAKSQKKSSKKSSLSSQKVKALSFISTGKRHNGEGGQAKAHWHSGIFGGLIKAEGAVPLVTCVPTKVVFTRILEAVGRLPLALAHHVRMASPSVRDPP